MKARKTGKTTRGQGKKTALRRARSASKIASPDGERLVLRRWGNSAGIRIPSAMMHTAKFQLDDELEAHVEKGRIIVERRASKKYSLKQLLTDVTPEKCADSFESSKPAGKEAW